RLAGADVAGHEAVLAARLERPDAAVEGAPVEDLEALQAESRARVARREIEQGFVRGGGHRWQVDPACDETRVFCQSQSPRGTGLRRRERRPRRAPCTPRGAARARSATARPRKPSESAAPRTARPGRAAAAGTRARPR